MNEPSGETSPRWSRRASIMIAALCVLLDQITKHWAVSSLDDGHVVDVFWTLRFNLAFNGGMAFGRGQSLGAIIGVVATVVVVGLLVSLKRGNGPLATIAVGLIVGGAIGNIVDRLFREEAWFRGRVVDFIDFQWFPIFNVADACINVGGALLVIGFLSRSAA
ncbi:MAG: signal peptidase II [Acidimicrobiia bacterium]